MLAYERPNISLSVPAGGPVCVPATGCVRMGRGAVRSPRLSQHQQAPGEEQSGAEVGRSSAPYSSSDDDYGTSAVYNPGPLRVGPSCARLKPGMTPAPKAPNLRPVRIERVQGEESEDEVVPSGQHNNTTKEEGGLRALASAQSCGNRAEWCASCAKGTSKSE